MRPRIMRAYQGHLASRQAMSTFSSPGPIMPTRARMSTSLGNDIHKVGITPDVEVELPDDATSDVQLEKALEVVKGLESAE